MRTKVLIALTAGAIAAGATVPAAADPRREFLPMTCSDGRTVSISPAPANGTFTPNFDAATTGVFIPLSIQVSRTLRDGPGQIVSVDQAPAQVLGQGKQLERARVVACWASETLTSAQDPEIPPGDTLDITVSLLGRWTPRE
jgi:hypothetical protein